MRADVDLAIVGSGFGGSILAMVARRLGLRTALLERGTHPRFAIGESASPLAGILVEQLADRYDLPRIRPLAAYGTWQRAYPEVGCGLKRGFTYFKHEEGAGYCTDTRRSNQLLVAASPSDELSDTHWLRADVDHFLVREAIALGVEYVDRVVLQEASVDDSAGVRLAGERQGRPFRLCARFVVDASGPRGFLTRALGIGDRGFSAYPATQALFSHFSDVSRCDGMPMFLNGDDPPYPADDAALHHVFDDGWMWVLRFGNGITSAGVAVRDRLAAELRLAEGAPAWDRLLRRYPSIAEQFCEARPVREFTWMPRLAYRAEHAAGGRWAMLPSAAAFVDPLFSTGIPLTLLGVERLARLLEQGAPPPARGLRDYARATLEEADYTARYIAGCYAAFSTFDSFAAYSMFYFAAASFSEMARRVDAPRRPRRFLCSDHERFGPAAMRLAPPALQARTCWSDVAGAIECINIAGLCDPEKRNWYPADVEDAVRGAAKLGVPAERVRTALAELTTPRMPPPARGPSSTSIPG